MSSGSLPIETYHRAQTLGSGTYGSVVAVYNDDGQEFAMKLFVDDDDVEEDEQTPGMNIGRLEGDIRSSTYCAMKMRTRILLRLWMLRYLRAVNASKKEQE